MILFAQCTDNNPRHESGGGGRMTPADPVRFQVQKKKKGIYECHLGWRWKVFGPLTIYLEVGEHAITALFTYIYIYIKLSVLPRGAIGCGR